MSEYELHSWFVAEASERTQATKRLQKLLDRKWQGEIRRYGAAGGDGEIARLWRDDRSSGNVAGAFWAIISHPGVSSDLSHRVYQELHMLSHQVGAGHRADLARLKELERENRRLLQESQRAAAHGAGRLAEKEREIHQLKEALARSRLAELRLKELERGTTVSRLRERVESLQQRLDREEREQQRLRRLLGRSFTLVNGPGGVESPLQADECDSCPHSEEGEPCQLPDLCGRSVLCVGGRSGSTHHYRELVERSNGRFIHHDGGKEDNPHLLKGMMGKADLVVCPAGCVSHAAYWQVKQFCKETGKPCVLLRSASSSSWAEAITALGVPSKAVEGMTILGRRE